MQYHKFQQLITDDPNNHYDTCVYMLSQLIVPECEWMY